MKTDQIHQLAALLAQRYAEVTPTQCGIYGHRMERALIRDTFTSLYYGGDMRTLDTIRVSMDESDKALAHN